jgi:hypothetical protein
LETRPFNYQENVSEARSFEDLPNGGQKRKRVFLGFPEPNWSWSWSQQQSSMGTNAVLVTIDKVGVRRGQIEKQNANSKDWRWFAIVE